MFIEHATSDPAFFFSWIVCIIFSICVHESAHAWVAVRFGDETPRDHITLNPLKQMGWMSIGMLMLVGIAWGAVPVSPHGCGNRKHDALVSFAGPLSNLALCAIFALLSQTARLWEAPELAEFFHTGSWVNGALCLLNLCPVPPLDGFGIIKAFLPSHIRLNPSLNKMAGIGLLILFITPLGSVLFRFGGNLSTVFADLWLLPFQLFS